MNYIHRTAILYPDVVIEDDVRIGPYCIVGGPPEHREFYDSKKPTRGVRIEKGVRISSHVTIDAGTETQTVIGQGSAIFQSTHVGHDCIIGSNVTVGGKTSLAGHTRVMDHAVISGHSCTFQRVVVGSYAFVGGQSFVVRNVPPCEKWIGNRFAGYNAVGLDRGGIDLKTAQDMYGKEYERLTSRTT